MLNILWFSIVFFFEKLNQIPTLHAKKDYHYHRSAMPE
tara:strand:+ start:4762 stop:4875 length:114 start_codon:yes stop_codon:yes gene_type:complete